MNDMMCEMQRQSRVVDQSVTMYSVLRDRYARRALMLTLGIFAASAFLCAFTFLPADILKCMNVSEPLARLALAGLSTVVFFLSIAELCLGWRDKSSQHREAAKTLSCLKARFRLALSQGTPPSNDEVRLLATEYGKVMDGLPHIPDVAFLALKAYHLRKVALSKMISVKPGHPIWLLRLRLMMRGRFENAKDS